VFQLIGHHYHNKKLDENQGAVYLQRALLKNLRQDEVAIPVELRRQGGPAAFPVKKLGIGYPVVLDAGNIDDRYELTVEDFDDPDAEKKAAVDKKEKGPGRGAAGPMGRQPPMGAMAGAGGAPGAVRTKRIPAPRFDFIVQFCWQAPSPDEMAKIAQEIPSGEPIPEAAVVKGAAEEAAEEEMAEEAEDKAAKPGEESPEDSGEKPEADESVPPKDAAAPAKESAEEPGDNEPGDNEPGDNEPGDNEPADKNPAVGEAAKPKE
jgi:hypothetical protein